MAKLKLREVVLLVLGLFIGGCCGFLLSVLIASYQYEDYVTIAKSRVQIGDDRGQALGVLSDAWFQSECNYPDGAVDDLFMYGARDPETVAVVVLTSELSEGKLLVTFVGSLDGDVALTMDDPTPTCEPPIITAFE